MIEGQASTRTVFKGNGRLDSRRQAMRSVATLRKERAELEEEIRQLRAAAQVYSEVVQRLSDKAYVKS